MSVNNNLLEDIRMMLDDSLRRLYEEKQKPAKERDDHLILKLKKHINDSSVLLSELSLGSPVVAGLKAKFDKFQNGDDSLGVDYYYRHSLKQN